MIADLQKMNSRQPDGRGDYLGNGMPHVTPLRALDLADLLEEVLALRALEAFVKEQEDLSRYR